MSYIFVDVSSFTKCYLKETEKRGCHISLDHIHSKVETTPFMLHLSLTLLSSHFHGISSCGTNTFFKLQILNFRTELIA